MALLEVTAKEFNWSVPRKGGRVVIRYPQGGPYTVTRQCLDDAIAAGAGEEAERPEKATDA